MLQTLSDTFTPLLWGGVLALLLNLPLRAVEAHLTHCRPRTRRVLGLTLVLVGLVGALFLGLWLLIPQLAAAIASITEALPSIYTQLQNWLANLQLQFANGGVVDSAVVFSTQRVEAAGETAVSGLMNMGVAAATYTAQQLVRFAIALVLAVYLLASKENLCHKACLVARALLGKARAAHLAAIVCRANTVFSAFIIGQCVEACILAALFVLVLFFAGMPSVLPIATFIGVSALIPVFGSIAGGIFGFLLIAASAPAKSIWFLLLFVLVQQFENNIIYPRVVGARVGLPPVWVLLAVVIGGGLFGMAGLLLAIPATSVLYQLGGDWVHARTAPRPDDQR